MRLAAAEKLTDQASLAYVARNANDVKVRLEVAAKLTDRTIAEGVFADIAKTASGWMRLEAATKLTEQALGQSVFAEIAKTDSDEQLRKGAVEKITDQFALADLAKNADDHDVRKSAVEKLTDQTLLVDFAANDRSPFVRLEAAKRLTDRALAQRVFYELFVWEGHGFYLPVSKSPRKEALEGLTDQELLAALAMSEPMRDKVWHDVDDYSYYPGRGGLAVGKLSDRNLLGKVAKNASDNEVRAEAVKRLTDRTLLAEIAENDSER